MNAGPRRRSNAVAAVAGLNYAEIGATSGREVLAFPPAGYAVAEHRHRIGSGSDRFDRAGRSLMTWGVLRRAGVDVTDVQVEEGSVPLTGAEPRSVEDGSLWITPGMTARVLLRARPVPLGGLVKVVSVIDEPGRMGFTYGSCPGHTAQCEQLLQLEHEPDDSVWLMIRTMLRPLGGRFSVAAALHRLGSRDLDRRFAAALHPANVG